MQVTVKKGNFDIPCDLLAVSVLQGTQLPKELSEFAKSIRKEVFDGKENQVLLLDTMGKGKWKYLLLFGFGEEKELLLDKFRAFAGSAVRASKSTKSAIICAIVPEIKLFQKTEISQAISEGALLSNYKCTKFKSKKGEGADKEPEFEPKEFSIVSTDTKGVEAAVNRGSILAGAQNYVRDINENPANIVTPQKLAEFAKDLSKNPNISCTVYEKDALKKAGMNGILAVNQGSDLPPVLIMLEYNKDKKLPHYCVVGKGITFDSGGISIKPSKGMHEMKYDKTGAVCTLGIIKAVAELGLPIRLTGLMPATENMPSGSAQKPGDIITMYNGKTTEVLNTDAEGRLILGDALAFAAEKKPDAIIDLATLTGAIIVALGPHAAGLFSNDDEVASALMSAGEKTHERVWRMPLWKDYAEMIKGDFADIKNIGSESGEASSITAAKFLQEFVGECKWAHLDIAGVDNIKAAHPYMEKGASGIGVRLVVSALERLAAKK